MCPKHEQRLNLIIPREFYSLDPIKSTMILPERFQKKHGKMIMENMILPVQIFLASRDLQYDFPKIGSLRSPVCNFLFTFVQVWLPNLRSQHFVPNLFSQKNRTYRQLFQFILNEKMSGLALISSKSG